MDSGNNDDLWWWYVDVALRCAVVAFVAHTLLVPWTLWLTRRALCWARCALSSALAADEPARPGQRPPTCGCCDGIDFDGMVGRWAVVTGCTDGIGKEFAIQLADRGMHVALVSRNPVKLQAVADEIYRLHGDGVRTRIVVADFTSSRGTVSLSDTYDRVRRGLDGLDVAVLLNNAGMSYLHADRLLDLPPCCSSDLSSAGGDPIRDVIECNVLATVTMCRMVMSMIGGGPETDVGEPERAEQDGGGGGGDEPLRSSTPPPPPPSPLTVGGVVINVASVSALVPCPLLSVYGASKAFVYKFSTELAAEYARRRGADDDSTLPALPKPVAVRCLTTGFVATKMSRLRSMTVGLNWIPSSTVYASRSLQSLACHCGCRLLRNKQTARGGGTGKTTTRDGPMAWLTGAMCAVVDSPTSPFSVGITGIVTTGYAAHTIMVNIIQMAIFLVGETFISKLTFKTMAIGRSRVIQYEELKLKKAEAKNNNQMAKDKQM